MASENFVVFEVFVPRGGHFGHAKPYLVQVSYLLCYAFDSGYSVAVLNLLKGLPVNGDLHFKFAQSILGGSSHCQV